MSIKETRDGTVLSIFVKPNSTKFRVEYENNEVTVYATEEPEKGKVNKEIIKELTRRLGFGVEIVSGLTSKQKTLLLRGAKKPQVEATLTDLGR